MKKWFLRVGLTGCALVSVGCAAGGPTSPSTASASQNVSGTQSVTNPGSAATVPDPPQGCEPWPVQLADMFARLPLLDRLCLKRDNEPQASTYIYATRTVILRQDSNPYGDLARVSHELGHTHQHWSILQAGFPDIDPQNPDQSAWVQEYWMRTPEGREWHATTGAVFLGFGGACTRYAARECWTQDESSCEMHFCLLPGPTRGPGFQNPKEENADFIGAWYNPGNVSRWGRANLTRDCPRRAAWANGTGGSQVWLP